MTKSFLYSVFLALVFATSGCTGTVQMVSPEERQALSLEATQTPRLHTGDKIKVTVFGEDQLTGEYEIDPAGAVSLPLAGTVRVAGLTKLQLEQQLRRKFRTEYLRNPKVTVDIVTFRPIYIYGEVGKPGEYAYKPGLNVVSATAMAGGLTFRARPNSIVIQHVNEAASKQYPFDSTVPVLPGDIIRVPARYF